MSQRLLSLAGLVAILCSGAQTGWIVAAVCVWAVTGAAVRRARRKSMDMTALTLRGDGSAVIAASTGAEEALPCAGGWASRWLSVLTLQLMNSGKRIHLVVCRSVNDADAYRHLLTQLRLRSADAARGTLSRA